MGRVILELSMAHRLPLAVLSLFLVGAGVGVHAQSDTQSAAEVQDPQGPEACFDPQSVTASLTYQATIQLSMYESICGQLAPASLPAFARVQDHYRRADPACFAAARAAPALAEFHRDPEIAALLASIRDGAAGGGKKRRELESIVSGCLDVEQQYEKLWEDERTEAKVFSDVLQRTDGDAK